MKYDVEYFINKFETIPEEQWCMYEFENSIGQRCALGHCGITTKNVSELLNPRHPRQEGSELHKLIERFFQVSVFDINDGHDTFGISGNTPKDRMLSALNTIKHMEKKNVKR